ncbi:MAG: lipoyl(octanoyl) transferase LipB [Proteobacteria bacterium]|jgi:lipoate-protein ligase B|nr:lipoyl(octanoyl) transferase LipB [Pseudomonadota bacterium]
MLEFQNWGLISYEEAFKKQEELAEKIALEKSQGVLVFCTHPPIVTLGRKTQAGDVYAWSGTIKEINRGGRATYHGPSQLVVYPLLNLAYQGKSPDIHRYLRIFEDSIAEVISSYGVKAMGKTLQSKPNGEREEETGVWVGSQKVASLGIAVKKWVTLHGAAINLDEDPRAFEGMKPCGFSKETMVSLEKLVGHSMDRSDFEKRLQEKLLKSLTT